MLFKPHTTPGECESWGETCVIGLGLEGHSIAKEKDGARECLCYDTLTHNRQRITARINIYCPTCQSVHQWSVGLTRLLLIATGVVKGDASHLCGDFSCLRPSDLYWEPAKSNSSRKRCHGLRVECRHAVRCTIRRHRRAMVNHLPRSFKIKLNKSIDRQIQRYIQMAQ